MVNFAILGCGCPLIYSTSSVGLSFHLSIVPSFQLNQARRLTSALKVYWSLEFSFQSKVQLSNGSNECHNLFLPDARPRYGLFERSDGQLSFMHRILP